MGSKFDDKDLTPHALDYSVDQRTFEVMQAARAECPKTEQQIADAGGISRGTVTKYFNGDIKQPQFATVLRIWRGMGYGDDELYRRVFSVHGPTTDTEAADRIGAEAGLAVEIEYLKTDNRRLLEVVQDRLSENAYHKQEIARLVDDHDGDLARQAEEYDRLIAEKERENRRLFVALWIAVGAMVAILTGLTALIVHDLGNPDAGWFRAVQAAGESLRGVVWNL